MKMSENRIDWGAANFRLRQRMDAKQFQREPAVDEIISRIVGFKVFQCDPRVIRLTIKWKKGKPVDSLEPDNFLQNPNFISELKEVLSKPL